MGWLRPWTWQVTRKIYRDLLQKDLIWLLSSYHTHSLSAYCVAPGDVLSGDVCVFRGDYHVVYILVKNDYIDNKISYRLLRDWILNSYVKDRILKENCFKFEQPQDTTIAVSTGLVARYARLRETVLNPLIAGNTCNGTSLSARDSGTGISSCFNMACISTSLLNS